jgi:hypothetical protein
MDHGALADLPPILGPTAFRVTVVRRDTGRRVCTPVVLRNPTPERLAFYRQRYAGIVARKLGLGAVCEARVESASGGMGRVA